MFSHNFFLKYCVQCSWLLKKRWKSCNAKRNFVNVFLMKSVPGMVCENHSDFPEIFSFVWCFHFTTWKHSYGLFTRERGQDRYREQDWHNREQWVLVPVPVSDQCETFCITLLSIWPLYQTRPRFRAEWIDHITAENLSFVRNVRNLFPAPGCPKMCN